MSNTFFQGGDKFCMEDSPLWLRACLEHKGKMTEYSFYNCIRYRNAKIRQSIYSNQSWRKGPPYPRPGEGPSKKGTPKSDRVPLLRHIETPELNSPRTDFPFRHSYLSNTSSKFIFTRPVTSWSQPLRNALWTASLSALALVSWLLFR